MALIDPKINDHTDRLICRECQWVLTDAICACNAPHGYRSGDPADFPDHVCRPSASSTTSRGPSTNRLQENQ